MKEKYVIKDYENDVIKIVWLAEEQAKAIDWFINQLDLVDISIDKLSEYNAEEID